MLVDDFNTRSLEIFRKVVESFLESGEPVASGKLHRTGAFDLSPASIRNVMADLEEAGLLFAPHTSAGRLPTERGLRLFASPWMVEREDCGVPARAGSPDKRPRWRCGAQGGRPQARRPRNCLVLERSA